MNLKQICEAIEAGYAADKSGLDDDMLPLLQELADQTSEILELMRECDELRTALAERSQ